MTLRELEYEMMEVVANRLLYRHREFLFSRDLYHAFNSTRQTPWPMNIVVYEVHGNPKGDARQWYAWWDTPLIEGDPDNLVTRYIAHD